MSAHDYVKYSAPCPWCGSAIVDWQAKEECSMRVYESKELSYFYGQCRSCELFVEINTGRLVGGEKVNRSNPT